MSARFCHEQDGKARNYSIAILINIIMKGLSYAEKCNGISGAYNKAGSW